MTALAEITGGSLWSNASTEVAPKRYRTLADTTCGSLNHLDADSCPVAIDDVTAETEQLSPPGGPPGTGFDRTLRRRTVRRNGRDSPRKFTSNQEVNLYFTLSTEDSHD